MRAWPSRLLNIREGEGRRTALIYLLYSLSVLGYVWGAPASRALFIEQVGLDSYSFLFVADAVFTLAITLVYTAFVDRVGNARLLAAVCVTTSAALLLAGLLLVSGPTVAFYLFYLISQAVRVVFTVQVWSYTADFYDTRAAKRLFPLLGSAGRVTGFLGGLLFPLIVRTVHAQNIPYLWAGLLAVSAWLAVRIPHWTENPASFTAPGRKTGTWENFQGGWRAIRNSKLLRLLAIGTTAMTLLLALLNFEVDYAFFQRYKDADDLASLFALLTGLANGIALPFQLFLLSRIVNRIGVGWANLFYPVLAVGTYGLLSAFVLLPLAVLGVFVRTAFRWGIRNPLDNMLYNAVPRMVRGRARAFVNALLVPLATFLAGLILFFVPRGDPLPWYLSILGGVVGLVYLIAAWYIRPAYRQALVDTLAAEGADLYQLAGAEWDAADRAALGHVLTRLRESRDEGTTIFLAQLAYEIGGQDALPALAEIAAQRGPVVRAAILETVGAADLSHPRVRQLCVASLADADPVVRHAALTLLEQSGPGDMPLLAQALNLLHDPDADVRVCAISLLLRSGDFYYLTAAAGALNELLTAADPSLRALALSALGQMGDPRFVRTLMPHLSDTSESVRRAAAQAIAAVASASAPPWVRELTLEAALQALSDPAEAVRLAAVQILARLPATQSRPALLQTLQDPSVRVRESGRQVIESMGSSVINDLETLLDVESGHAREAAIVALLHLATERYRTQANAEIHAALEQAYHNLALAEALAPLEFSGAALATHTLNDRNQALLEHILGILAALHGDETIAVIRRNLQAADKRTRANAVEALEATSSPLIARLVAPLCSGPDGTGGENTATLAQEEFGLRPIDPAAALETLFTGQDPWLAAVGLYLVGEAWQRPSPASHQLVSHARCQEIVTAALDSSDPLVAETARQVAHRLGLSSADEEVRRMLSTIEKVIFLKQVPIFGEMTVAQIRTLAGIAEEVHLQDDDIIFREGEPGDTLYVVVSGRVGIEHEAQNKSGSVARLATLGPRQYFGEMSIFDQAPRSATAIAIGQTLLLSIRREPLIALIEGDPTLALELIRVLSQRLRSVNEELARKTKTAPRKLQKLYDQLI